MINKSDLQKGQVAIKDSRYQADRALKGYFNGKFYGDDNIIYLSGIKIDLKIETLYLVDFSTNQTITTTKKDANGLCPKCGTYCYGDCSY